MVADLERQRSPAISIGARLENGPDLLVSEKPVFRELADGERHDKALGHAPLTIRRGEGRRSVRCASRRSKLIHEPLTGFFANSHLTKIPFTRPFGP